jgi:hypothetical protein
MAGCLSQEYLAGELGGGEDDEEVDENAGDFFHRRICYRTADWLVSRENPPAANRCYNRNNGIARAPYASRSPFSRLAVACGGGMEKANLPKPESPDDAAERFLSLWKDDKFQEMYTLLSVEARATIDEQRFIDRHTAIKEEARIDSLDYELQGGSPTSQGRRPARRFRGGHEVPFTVTSHHVLRGYRAGEWYRW